MFRYQLDPNDPIYRRSRGAPEPPPTAAEMFRTLALAFAGIVFMVVVILFFATVLVR